MAIKAVLFDIDGTLADSNDFHVRAWAEAFGQFETHFDDQTIHDQIGKGTDNLVPTLMPGTDAETQEAIGDAHGRAFKTKYLNQVQPFAKAYELVKRVHDTGAKVVLASSASKEELDHYIQLLGLRGIVDATTSADDVERTKPAPDIFSTALKKLSPLPASNTLVVGDTPYDMEAAGKCGIAAIAVRSGKFADHALRAAGAIAIYDDVATLLDEFDRSPLATGR